MRQERRIAFVSLFVLLILTALLIRFKPIAAYLTARDDNRSVMNPGYNVTAIQEEFPEQGALTEQGKTYIKRVAVKNRESVPCYVRVSVDYSDSRIGNSASLLGLNTTDWDYIETDQPQMGGYYYYKQPVMPGKSTTYLFEGIRFAENRDPSFFESGEEFEVILYEESVQQGNYTSYLKAWSDFVRE